MKNNVIALIAAAALASASAPAARADGGWATAGKVLTGVVAGALLVKAFETPPVYQVMSR